MAEVAHYVPDAGVDPHASDVQVFGESHSATVVLRPDRRCEALLRAVGPGERLRFVGELLHGDDGADDRGDAANFGTSIPARTEPVIDTICDLGELLGAGLPRIRDAKQRKLALGGSGQGRSRRENQARIATDLVEIYNPRCGFTCRECTSLTESEHDVHEQNDPGEAGSAR